MSTPKGGQYQLILSDGSKVWLNSLSSIHFPTVFTGSERKVVVTGEAYFEVAADAKHPFHVSSGGADIEVLGTHFNVNAYTDELMMKTTLLEGSVKVRKGSEASIVSSGQQLQIAGTYGGGTQLRLVRDADMEQAVAWKNGLFYLKGANIKEIMRQISRWYNVNIYYDGDVSNIDFYGVVSRRKSVEELLEIMEKTGIVHFKLEGSSITVSK